MKTRPKPTAGTEPRTAVPQPANCPPTIPSALANFDVLPDSAFVRLPVVAGLNGISPATAWRWVKSGRLPAPIKTGPNTTVWRVGDLRRAAAGA